MLVLSIAPVIPGAAVRASADDQLRVHAEPGQAGLQPGRQVLLLAEVPRLAAAKGLLLET